MRFLNVGSGNVPIPIGGIIETSFDIDPQVKPDIVGDARELILLPKAEYDAVWCSHLLEHFYEHEIPSILGGMYHVLNKNGVLIAMVPDLKAMMDIMISNSLGIDNVLYQSPAGPVRAKDMLYGLQSQVKQGNSFYAHKTGFDRHSLKDVLMSAGFRRIYIQQADLEVRAVACKATAPEMIVNFFNIGEQYGDVT